MRFAIAAATGIGVGVLLWLGFYPEPGAIRTTIYAVLAFSWAMGGLNLSDIIPPKKERDLKF